MNLNGAVAKPHGSMDDVNPSFLTLIVDCKGLASLWQLQADGSCSSKTVADLVRTLVLFLHSYMLLHRDNHVCVVAANISSKRERSSSGGRNDYEVLFPPPSANGCFVPSSVHALTEVVNAGMVRCIGKEQEAAASAALEVPAEACASVARPLSMILCGKLRLLPLPLILGVLSYSFAFFVRMPQPSTNS